MCSDVLFAVLICLYVHQFLFCMFTLFYFLYVVGSSDIRASAPISPSSTDSRPHSHGSGLSSPQLLRSSAYPPPSAAMPRPTRSSPPPNVTVQPVLPIPYPHATAAAQSAMAMIQKSQQDFALIAYLQQQAAVAAAANYRPNHVSSHPAAHLDLWQQYAGGVPPLNPLSPYLMPPSQERQEIESMRQCNFNYYRYLVQKSFSLDAARQASEPSSPVASTSLASSSVASTSAGTSTISSAGSLPSASFRRPHRLHPYGRLSPPAPAPAPAPASAQAPAASSLKFSVDNIMNNKTPHSSSTSPPAPPAATSAATSAASSVHTSATPSVVPSSAHNQLNNMERMVDGLNSRPTM